MLERSGWQYKTMKDICYVNQGFQINIEKRDKHKRKNNKVYITIQHLNSVGDDEYINDKDHNDSVVCNPNDVLMTRTGNTGRVVTGVSGVFHNNFFRINFDRSKIDKDYLVYYLNLKSIQNLILEKAGASTIPDLNHGDFYSIPFNYPENLNEQRAIAKTFINIDNLINSLQFLILKKEKIKKQTMNILFDKNNFKSELKTICLNKIGYAYNGLSGMKSENFKDGNKKYITFLNVLGNPIVKEQQFEKFYCNNVQKKVQKGDLFFNTSSETPEEVALCSTINFDIDELYLNSFCFGFRITDHSINNLYLSYFYRSKYGRNIIKNLAQGSTRYNLPKKRFMEYSICVPSDTNEQIEYANILMNMDNEIELLNEKLSKYKKIKDGMMEDLLTGKVRLSYE